MSDSSPQDQGQRAHKVRNRDWAPWWAYLIPIVIVNQIRQEIMGRDRSDWVTLVVGVVAALAVCTVISFGYRAYARRL